MPSMRRPPRAASLVLALVVAAVALLGVGCGGGSSSSTSAQPGAVAVVDNDFKPNKVSVAVGDTVTWTWQGNVQHNVTPTGDNRSTWKASATQKDGTYTNTFSKAGTYTYLCTIHPGMKGSVTVS